MGRYYIIAEPIGSWNEMDEVLDAKRSVPRSRVGSGPMGAVTNVYRTNGKVKQNGETLE
jgi:hypothetical protein